MDGYRGVIECLDRARRLRTIITHIVPGLKEACGPLKVSVSGNPFLIHKIVENGLATAPPCEIVGLDGPTRPGMPFGQIDPTGSQIDLSWERGRFLSFG